MVILLSPHITICPKFWSKLKYEKWYSNIQVSRWCISFSIGLFSVEHIRLLWLNKWKYETRQVRVQVGRWCTDKEADWSFCSKICWVSDGLDWSSAWWWIYIPTKARYYILRAVCFQIIWYSIIDLLIYLRYLCFRSTISSEFQGGCKNNIQTAVSCICPHIPLTLSEDSESQGRGTP